MQTAFPTPQGGAALLLSFRLDHRVTLILGSGTLAATRAFAALEADSSVILLANCGLNAACEELQWRTRQGQIRFVDWDELPSSSSGPHKDTDSLDAFLQATPGILLAVITDTLSTSQRRTFASAEQLYRVFRARNIPVNTADIPSLCDFSFASSHRFLHHQSGDKTSLQIGVTTNGQGCRLAARIRRDIVSKLPREAGAAVVKVGQLRSMAKEEVAPSEEKGLLDHEAGEEELCEESGVLTPNRPVPLRSNSENALEARNRRIRWVAQVSEYWPISKLASMSQSEMKDVLAEDNHLSFDNTTDILGVSQPQQSSLHFNTLRKLGRILLVGSGPGHPSLLTMATHTALTQLADLVLSDKLVPPAVLSIIPNHVQVRIARKFPGNAEGAQTEMMEAAVEAAKQGLTVIRVRLSFYHLSLFYSIHLIIVNITSLNKETRWYTDVRAKKCFTSVLMDSNRL